MSKIKDLLHRARIFLFYGDTSRDEYRTVRPKIEESNRKTALVFTSVAAILISVMFGLSFIFDSFRTSRDIYMYGVIASIIQLCIALAAKTVKFLSYISVYLAISTFLVYGMAIGILSRGDSPTVTFMVMLIFVPLIFLDRPIRMAFVLSIYVIAFIALAINTKTEPVLSVDVTDAVMFGLLAMIAESVVYRSKIRGYVLENKLHIMSETDQLTGLNNRNCYEWRLDMYASNFTKSICCIYIDVNGLHELNNTRGHKSGDKMLIFIADVIKNTFGKDDTYRIGGDEYVAFVIDGDEEEIKKRIENAKTYIARENYHAAIGYKYSTDKFIDINKLTVAAESEMYKDKSAYYKNHDRRTRK